MMNIETFSEYHWQPIKGKIAVFIMTFSGDEGCLTQCLRALDEQRKSRDIEIFILDDASSPLESVPDGVHYRKTYFNRHGNLNGTECAHGELMEMCRCARESRAEYVMKVDSDMIIRSLTNFLAPLETDRHQVIGFKLTKTMNYCAGVTYIMPSMGLYKAIREFSAWYREAQADPMWIAHCPEVWAVSRCVAKVNGYQMTQHDQSIHPENWLLSPFNFDEMREDGSISPLTLTRYTLYDFVNFGNRYEMDVENPREVAAMCMKKFVDFDLLNTFEP